MVCPLPGETCNFYRNVGTLLTPGFCDWQSAGAAMESKSSKYQPFAIRPLADGYSRQLSTKTPVLRASLATAMPILPTHPHLFVAPRCEWRKPVLSIVLSARLTALAFAQSKSWAGSLVLQAPRWNGPSRQGLRIQTVPITGNQDCETDFVS